MLYKRSPVSEYTCYKQNKPTDYYNLLAESRVNKKHSVALRGTYITCNAEMKNLYYNTRTRACIIINQ